MTKHNDNKLSAIAKIVSAYNNVEEASITWSPKDKCLKLHDKDLTPVTAAWINEYLITGKIEGEDDQITVDDFKNFKVTDEDIKYFDIPWVDGHIDDEAIKYFKEVHDDESLDYVYWSGNGNIKRVKY